MPVHDIIPRYLKRMKDEPDKNALGEQRTDMAEDRTEWAEDRTILANERTFAAWMRTGMAAVAIAIGLKAVFGAFEPTWAAKAVATVFIIVALLIYGVAQRSAHTTHRRLSDHDANAQPPRNFTIIAIIMALGSFATGVVLWKL